MTDFSSIDVTMPKGMSHDEHVVWLREVGAQLRAVSGQQPGSTPPLDVGQAQPTWFMWWDDDDQDAD